MKQSFLGYVLLTGVISVSVGLLIPLLLRGIPTQPVLINREVLILFWYTDCRQSLSRSQFGIPRDFSVKKCLGYLFLFFLSFFFPPLIPLHELPISSRPEPDFITITHSSWSSFNIWKDRLLTGNGQFFFLWLLKYNFQFLIWFI